MNSKKKSIFRIFLVIFLLVMFLIGTYFLLLYTGWWERLNSIDKLKKTILDLGLYGRVFFVFLQFVQVAFLPIPSPLIVVAGTLIYGPFQASLLSLAGILLGSAVAFLIGRVFGKKVVVFMVGKENAQKWSKFLSNGKYSFVIMMFLPLFPDDVLCMVAGLTDMTWTFFMITQLVTRTTGVFVMSYLSSGEIIPFYGWGIYVWIALFVLASVLIYLSIKYNSKIENYIYNLFNKRKNLANKNNRSKS